MSVFKVPPYGRRPYLTLVQGGPWDTGRDDPTWTEYRLEQLAALTAPVLRHPTLGGVLWIGDGVRDE